MKIRFKKGILIAIISIVMVLLTVITSFALSFDYSGTGSSTTGGSGNLSNTSFSINTTDIDKLVIGYRFSVADKNGNIKGKSCDVYNNSWSRYGITYDNYYAAYGQPSKKTWINGKNFNNDYKVSSLSYNKCASSSIDGTMPQKPSEIGGWLSKNSYKNARNLFYKCGFSKELIKDGDRLIVEPLIQTKLEGHYCVNTPTELAVIGGIIYGYNKQINTFTEGTFSTLNNYVQRKFPNQLRTNSAQSKLWGAAPYLSSRALYSTVINNGYGVSVVVASDDPTGNGLADPATYTVTYNANGGTGTMANSTATYGEPFKTRQNAFTRSYHKFTGWNEKADGSGTAWSIVPGTPNGGTYESGQSWTWTYTRNITLYAQWEKSEVVYYNANGGTVTNSSSSFKVDGDGWLRYKSDNKYFSKKWPVSNNAYQTTLSSDNKRNVFYKSSDFSITKPGYKFVGWTTNNPHDYANYGSDKAFVANQDNVAITSVPEKKPGEIWLYAVWAPITVTHDVNVDSVYSNLGYFPANRFATYASKDGSVTTNGVTYKHKLNTSTLTLTGTSTKNTQTTFAYQYDTIKANTTYYITLVYKSGGYSGASPYFVIDTGDSLGLYSTRNKVDVALPTKNNPVTKGSITVSSGRSSWVFWLWANGTTKYSNYNVDVFITTSNYVTDVAQLNYAVHDNNNILIHAYKDTTGKIKGTYLALPAAQNVYNSKNYIAPNQFLTHPFAYSFSSWNTVENGSGTKITSSTKITATDNHSVFAQYTKNKVNVKYNVDAADVKMNTTDYTIAKTNNGYIVQKDSSDYTKTYSYNDTITIPDGSKLVRPGYKFAGWKNPITGKIYNGDSTTVDEMFGYLADINGYTIILVAQWTPITYTVEFWQDIGKNNGYKDIVTNKYSNFTTVNQFSSGSTGFDANNNSFYKTTSSDSMIYKFDESKAVRENKYNVDFHIFKGWFVYSVEKDAFLLKDGQNKTYWEPASNMWKTGNETYSLYVVSDRQEISRLTDIDGDVVRLFALIEKPNNKISTDTKTWVPYKYSVVYCGNGATDYSYTSGVYSSSCGVSGHGSKPYIYNNSNSYFVDIDSLSKYNLSDKTKPIFDTNFGGIDTFSLTRNQFIKNGYHLDSKKAWRASCTINGVTKYYGRNNNGEYGWYTHSELGTDTKTGAKDFYCFADGQKNLVNLYTEHNDAVVYMHAYWQPNIYNIYYCGNGADGQTYGKVDVADANGSVFSYNKIDNCPDKNDGCASGNYYDNTKWTYDASSKALYANKFTKTGYTFAGWHAYDANSGLWYGYSDSKLGWYEKGKISSFKVFKDKESVGNLTSTNDGTVYMVAQWTPNPYYIVYSANGGTGTMLTGAYTKSLTNKAEENTTLYYDTEYYLRENAFTYGTREFSHWTLSAVVNGATKWYGTKNSVPGWYSESDFSSGAATYVKFENTVVKYDHIISGNVLKNLVLQSGTTITAHAQWIDTTIVYYNTNASDTKTSLKYNQNFKNDIMTALGIDKYSQTFYSENSNTGSNSGLNTIITINNDAFFELKRPGYQFAGWNSKKDGTGTQYSSTSTTIKSIRDGSEEPSDTGLTETTLYAQWVPNSYSIYYCGNGADSHTYIGDVVHGNSANHTCAEYNYCDPAKYLFDSNVTLKANKFMRAGYAFVGWSLVPNPGSKDIIYPDEASLSKLSEKDGDIVYLYAQWKPAQFYYNANYNGLSNAVGDNYTLNLNDDVCGIAGNVLYYGFVGSEITIYEPKQFGLSIEGYGFVGWSTNKQGTNIIKPGTYTTEGLLALFGNITNEKVPLYAIWSNRDVSFSYNVGKEFVSGTSSLIYKIDSNGFITLNGNQYKEFFYNPSEHSSASLCNIDNFKLTLNGNYILNGWIAHRTISGVDSYLDEGKVWRAYTDNNLSTYKPYYFKNGEIIENNPSYVSFTDLFGDELYVDDSNVCFYADWTEKKEYTVEIKYNIDKTINKNWLNISTNRFTVNDNGYICVDNSEYIESFYFTQSEINNIINNANTGEVFIKTVGESGFGISYDYHKFAGWTSVSSGKNYLSNIMTANNKNELQNSKKTTIVLTASWVENILSIKYNTNSGQVSGDFAIDKDDNVLENKNSGKIKTYTYNISSKVSIINCEQEYGFTKVGNVLIGYIVGAQTIDKQTAIETQYSPIDLAPELKYGDANITIFAEWKPNVINIIYNANDGFVDSSEYNVNTSTKDICVGNERFKHVVKYNDSTTIMSNADFGLNHNACNFIGWNTAIDGSGTAFNANESYKMFDYVNNINLEQQTIVLYAQWEPESYHVYYCGNGADGEGYTSYLNGLTESDADYGSIFDKGAFNGSTCGDNTCESIGNYYHNREWSLNQEYLLANNLFTRTGYVFAGYWTDEYGNQYAEGVPVENIPVDENGNAFLYAQWTPISYIIEYDGNGATDGIVSEQELLYEQFGNLNKNVFVKDYYHTDSSFAWIASREINGITHYCVAYDEEKHIATWKPENSINIDTDTYKFKNEAKVKNLSSVDGDIVTMHAVWIPNKLTIVYNANSGIVSNAEFATDDNEFITFESNVYKQTYVYDVLENTIDIHGSNHFGLVRESLEDTYFVFIGWAIDKTAYTPDYNNKNLANISIEQFAPDLKYTDVEVKLYAMWDVVDEIVLSYYEGELVTSETLNADFSNSNPFPNATFDVGAANGAPFVYPTTVNGFTPQSSDYGNYNVDGLYTYFEKLSKNETVKIIHPFSPNMAVGEKELFFYIDIIYNNVPEITACDRWFTLEEALSGKITKENLLKTAIAEDIESGDINHLLDIVDFESYSFDKVGEYEITYTVTDDIPAKGKNKTTTKTITVHITESYANEKVRFISENYYPLVSDLFVDSDGNFRAKKINGVLYYLNVNNELCLDSNGMAFPVDAGLTAKTLINADGTYTIIPLSKWYRNNECIASLQSCLNNTKDESGNWSHVEEVWVFSSEEIKAIHENLKNNVYDENFYANQYVNGNCVSITNKSEIAQTYDIGQNQLPYFDVDNNTIKGFTVDANIDSWRDTFNGYLVVPESIVIEDTVCKITTIESYAFSENDNITTVRIPDSITEIKPNAFIDCANLKTVYVEAKKEDIIIYENSFGPNVVIKYVE